MREDSATDTTPVEGVSVASYRPAGVPFGVREWVRMDTGLLDNEDLTALSGDAQLVWFRLYLALGRVYGTVRTLDGLRRMADRDNAGILPLEQIRAAFDEIAYAGWFTQVEGRWTIRGWIEYQGRKSGKTGSLESRGVPRPPK